MDLRLEGLTCILGRGHGTYRSIGPSSHVPPVDKCLLRIDRASRSVIHSTLSITSNSQNDVELHRTYGKSNINTCCNFNITQTLIWCLWGGSFVFTALRGFLRWKSQHRLFADDHFVFFGLLSLTALSVVITRLLPQFFLAQEYSKAAIADPNTPMPLPPDEFVERTRTALKLMFSQMLLFWTTLWAGRLRLLGRCQRILC